MIVLSRSGAARVAEIDLMMASAWTQAGMPATAATSLTAAPQIDVRAPRLSVGLGRSARR